MPHPFFEATTFPWHRPEAAGLTKDLARVEKNIATIDLEYRSCAEDLPPLTPGNAEVVWKEALENLVVARVLQVWCDNTLNNPRYKPIHPRISALRDAVDILRKVVLDVADENLIVLDRETLRDALDKLRLAAGPRKVLVVRGPKRSGKTWSKHLVEIAAAESGAVSIYMDVDTANTVDKAVDMMFSAMGRRKDKPQRTDQDTTDEAWYQSICRQLLDSANNSTAGSKWWIIMDDLGPETGVDPKVKSFFDQFALLMASDVFRRKFCLVLIDYPDKTTPTKWKNSQVSDQPNEADIDAATISKYLRGYAKAKKLKLEDAKADELAKTVVEFADTEIAKGPGEDGEIPARLQLIHDKLDEVAAKMGQGVE